MCTVASKRKSCNTITCCTHLARFSPHFPQTYASVSKRLQDNTTSTSAPEAERTKPSPAGGKGSTAQSLHSPPRQQPGRSCSRGSTAQGGRQLQHAAGSVQQHCVTPQARRVRFHSCCSHTRSVSASITRAGGPCPTGSCSRSRGFPASRPSVCVRVPMERGQRVSSPTCVQLRTRARNAGNGRESTGPPEAN